MLEKKAAEVRAAKGVILAD